VIRATGWTYEALWATELDDYLEILKSMARIPPVDLVVYRALGGKPRESQRISAREERKAVVARMKAEAAQKNRDPGAGET
jgi:hypothetical protein